MKTKTIQRGSEDKRMYHRTNSQVDKTVEMQPSFRRGRLWLARLHPHSTMQLHILCFGGSHQASHLSAVVCVGKKLCQTFRLEDMRSDFTNGIMNSTAIRVVSCCNDFQFPYVSTILKLLIGTQMNYQLSSSSSSLSRITLRFKARRRSMEGSSFSSRVAGGNS